MLIPCFGKGNSSKDNVQSVNISPIIAQEVAKIRFGTLVG